SDHPANRIVAWDQPESGFLDHVSATYRPGSLLGALEHGHPNTDFQEHHDRHRLPRKSPGTSLLFQLRKLHSSVAVFEPVSDEGHNRAKQPECRGNESLQGPARNDGNYGYGIDNLEPDPSAGISGVRRRD